jgi:hypothetical protein
MPSASDTPSSHSSQGRAQPDRAPREHVVAQRGPERGEPGPQQVVAKERVRPAAGAPGRIHERHATLRFVRDVEPWFQRARVFVAPLRHGAGMKGKVGQSLAFGLPVVTTRVGAEGMGLTHEIDAMIADDRVGFAEAVIRLYWPTGSGGAYPPRVGSSSGDPSRGRSSCVS